jgi:uncharacterized membrane protein YqaE (UPF0057 family)
MEAAMDSWNILISVLLGAIGLGYIVYGRRQMHGMALISGILLCVFPYFVSSIWIALPIAALLMTLPRFIDF